MKKIKNYRLILFAIMGVLAFFTLRLVVPGFFENGIFSTALTISSLLFLFLSKAGKEMIKDIRSEMTFKE